VLRNGHHGPESSRGGLVSPRVEAGPPEGLSTWAGLGARTSLPSREEVRCYHVPLRKRLLSQLCHMSGGSQPSAGRQPNYWIKCG
jgi:hypothetical protein